MQKYLTTLMLFIFLLNANSQQYLFQTLNVDDGLNHSFVESIVQDHHGYMWFATQHGLNRYDGYNFKKYITDSEDTNSFQFPFARTLYVDNDGDIVSAMRDKLMIFDYSNEVFNYYTNPFVNISELKEELEGLRILQDAQGYYWIGTLEAGLWLFDKKSEKFIPHYIYDNNTYSLISTPFFTIDENNRLWTLAFKEDKLYAVCIDLNDFHKKGRPEYSFYFLEDYIKNSRIDESLFYTINESLYLFVERSQVYKFESENNSWKPLNDDFWNSLYDKGESVTSMYAKEGNIWVGTSNNGLYIIDKNFKPIKNILADDNTKSVNTNTITNICKDNTGVLWIGTSQGLNYIDLNRKSFFEISKSTGILNNNNIISLSLDIDSSLWVSTHTGISILTHDLSTAQHFKNSKDFNHINIKDNHNMYPYKANIMFVSGPGMTKISFKDHIFQYSQPSEDLSSFADWTCWEIHKGKVTGLYWFATQDGLSMLIPNNYPIGIIGKQAQMPEKFYTYRQFDEGNRRFASNNIWCLHEAHDSVLWAGSIAGLTRFDLKTNEFKLIEPKSDSKYSTSSPKIKCIYEDTKNRIWVGSEGGGLDLLDNSGILLNNYNTKSGLCSDIVWGVMEDAHGNLWISTTDGLSKFNPENESFSNYYQSHGIPSIEFNRGAYLKGKDGKMYLGTRKGVVVFHPDSIKTNNIPPKVLISQLYLFNKPVEIGDKFNGDVILKKSIFETKELVFSHKNNVVSIEFVGIHFPAPDHITYKYMLEGFDSEWVETTSDQRRAHYTNLPAGEYKFRVKAANYDDVWSNDEASIVLFKILPPFWETWWFRGLIFIFITTVVILVFRYRIRSLKRRQAVLELQVKERTQEIQQQSEELRTQTENLQETNVLLEERQEEVIAQNEEISHQANELQKLNATKDKFFSIIAHDLKNPFHAISGISSLLKRSFSELADDKKQEFIAQIDQSSKSVSSLLENLLNWSRSQTNRIKYQPKAIDIKEIVDETVNLLKLNAEEKNITLVSEIKNKSTAYCDSNMITTVIRNLVSNAIKFTPEKGKIIISANEINDKLEIAIKDNGVGMKPEVINKLFQIDQQHSTKGTSGEGGTGLGLIICKEFVEKNGGEIWVESDPDGYQREKGSRFVFTLPLS